MRDIPCFRGACEKEGTQNLKWIRQIPSELYRKFPQFRGMSHGGVGHDFDSGIDLSITIDKLRVFINKRVGLSISIDSR